MNHVGGWMNGMSGGETWIWTVVGVLVIVVLVLAIARLVKK